MHPILFTIGSFSLYSYGLMMALALIAALSIMESEARRQGWDRDLVTRMAVSTFLFGLMGARAVYVLTRINDPSVNTWDLILNFRAGFVYYGGFAASWLFSIAFIYKHRKALPYWAVSDVFALCICMGLAIGRIGCLLGGCCYGAPCEYPWGVRMINEPGLGPVHPAQLYEFAMLMVFFAVLWQRRTRKSYNGELVVWYTAAYSVGRYLLEFGRGDLVRGFVIEPYLSTSQFLSLLFFIIAVVLHFKLKPKARS